MGTIKMSVRLVFNIREKILFDKWAVRDELLGKNYQFQYSWHLPRWRHVGYRQRYNGLFLLG